MSQQPNRSEKKSLRQHCHTFLFFSPRRSLHAAVPVLGLPGDALLILPCLLVLHRLFARTLAGAGTLTRVQLVVDLVGRWLGRLAVGQDVHLVVLDRGGRRWRSLVLVGVLVGGVLLGG